MKQPLLKSHALFSIFPMALVLMLNVMSREKSATTVSSGSSSGGEWDRPDGGAASRTANTNNNTNTNTFDHVERHSILNDPRAGR